MRPWHRRRVSERAYQLWQECGKAHGGDIADWLQAESDTRPHVRVTFDSNAWQQIVRPDKYSKDPRNSDFHSIQQAIVNGEVAGFIVETVATLEGIKRADRASYLAGARPALNVTESEEGGRIKISFQIAPKPSHHPGLAPILDDRLREALVLGFRFLKVPRIGQPSPAIAQDKANFPSESSSEMSDRQNRTFAALREIEPRGVGKSQVEALGQAVLQRTGKTGPWWSNLDQATANEVSQIAGAVGEWADGDSIAAHLGYQNDFFCTEDQGISAGNSILNSDNRLWLEQKHNVRFINLVGLANMLR